MDKKVSRKDSPATEAGSPSPEAKRKPIQDGTDRRCQRERVGTRSNGRTSPRSGSTCGDRSRWVITSGRQARSCGRTDFRRAAFTRAAEADIHPKRAAAAFDVTPETMLRYYTATEKKKTSDEILDRLAGRLQPKPKGKDEEE